MQHFRKSFLKKQKKKIKQQNYSKPESLKNAAITGKNIGNVTSQLSNIYKAILSNHTSDRLHVYRFFYILLLKWPLGCN